MGVELVLSLLGGLALFMYGMQMMSTNLEAVAGNRMKQILERLTANRFLGVLVGAGITALIQSSSATTVMTVGFVNSGLMTLKQAVWIIMGANIGTTVTSQLISLDHYGSQYRYDHYGTADCPGHRSIGSAHRLCGRYVPDFREK